MIVRPGRLVFSFPFCCPPRQKEVSILVDEAVKWLNNLLGLKLTPETLLDNLASGVVLCNLLLKIQANIKLGKVHPNASPNSFYAHDNVKAFLGGCTTLGSYLFFFFAVVS
jgi:hypothetical protein